ncbi:putative bifunctional diguanylate cyclase/phosphodiesterase [Marinobacterium arenosum]|uniref:putative bifunctional diguanylate cyclase/phosphodiesterase n=1 Tax=Marinobacterium arenosum TaxID=2862496 RepID=UPI001C95925D|nr:GGDEF and EAL domain-containing protein [Marinobacterium arenosum]MBY4676477.1 EAL domain-containing protein [Marinobacterium arenosum]
MNKEIAAVFRPLLHTSVGAAIISNDYLLAQVNPALAELLGYRAEQLQRMPLRELTAKGQRACHAADLERLMAGEIDTFDLRVDLVGAEQQLVHTHLSVTPLFDEQQRICAALMLVVDVTTEIRHGLELKKLFQAVESSGSAVVITDARGRIEYANSRFTDITGYHLDEVRGQTPAILRSENTSDSTYRELWGNLKAGQKWRGTLYNRRKNGTHYWALQSISPIHDERGTLVNIVSVSEDITAMKDHERQMEQLAYFDPLTQLGNRRNFREKLSEVLHQPCENYQALLLLDLDEFKQINDTLGHDAGDTLLTTIANRLRFCIEAPSTVYRLGGDEFTVILRDLPTLEGLKHKAQQVIDLLAQPMRIGTRELRITVSIGITLIHLDSTDSSALLRNADLAMYAAKERGRNNFQFFSPDMNVEARRSMTLEHDLRNAIEQHQLYLVYQPQVSLQSGRVQALEALIRWRHPTEGVVAPNDFIPKAEQTGLIKPIGRWVLEQACHSARQIQQLGLPPLKMSVNLSARQFDDEQLVDQISEILDQTGLEPRYLELEITEGVLMDNLQQAARILQRLRAMGIRIAIDDFGTGYSSLNYLKKMPVDVLKIDRSFVMEIPAEKDDMAITTTIITMAGQLGLSVVAEGIETREQLAFLQQQQCATGQGFLFSPPVSLEQFLTGYRAGQDYRDRFTPVFPSQ